MKLKEKLRIKTKELKEELTAIYYAYKDPNIKIMSKIIIAIIFVYALSPIDLIPDFIPVLGYLDPRFPKNYTKGNIKVANIMK